MSTSTHTILFSGREISCEHGANLKQVLLREGLSPYNGKARQVNCRGLGTCGTCAVEIEGKVSPMTRVETWRLGFPPHEEGSGLRLACQCQVLGDLRITKHPGFWGQHVSDPE